MRILLCIAIASLIMLAGLSCAYYNIYWMAEQEYQKAISSSKLQGFWNPYDMTPVSSDGSNLIDSCIKRCSKLLLLYPSSKWADDALLMLGNCFVLKGDYEKALKKYQELASLSRDPLLLGEARYMTAFTLALMGLPNDAIAELEKLSDAEAIGIREKALLVKGIIGFENGDIENAIIDLSAYLNRFPASNRVRQASLYLGKALIKADRTKEAIENLSKIANPADPLGSIASILIAKAHLANGDRDLASQVLTDVGLKAPDDTTRARAMLLLSSVHIEESDYHKAISVLASADSLIAGKVGTLKCEILYELGSVYETRLGDFVKAAEYYEKAAKGNSQCNRIAGRRSSALKSLRQYESVLGDSTKTTAEVRASTLFRIGEIYIQDLGLASDAVRYYQEVVDSFPNSEFAAKALLQLADIAESKQDTMAMVYYRLLVERFPQTVFANVARWKLNLSLIDIPFDTGEGSQKAEGEPGATHVGTPESGATGLDVSGPPSETMELPDTGSVDTLMEMDRRPREDYIHPGEPRLEEPVLEETTFIRRFGPDEIEEGQDREEDRLEDQ
ncbi:MAG: tetratricopeptide repeat protein [bacterium]